MSSVQLHPPAEPFDCQIRPPGSKSLTNRALLLAALCDGACSLEGVLFADDTRVMLEALQTLGFTLEIDPSARRVVVEGRAGEVPSRGARLMCGNSGTSIRFLTALCTLGRGCFELDGVARMRQRPIGPLVEMLRNLGSRVRSTISDGFPPVRVDADRLPGGSVRFGSESSSQFLSAVLHVGPFTRHELRVRLAAGQTSWPYVQMTMRVMDQFGCMVELERDPVSGEPTMIVVPSHRYSRASYAIEPDASNASYFLAAAAIRPAARLSVEGLGGESLQGDIDFAWLLKKLGARVEVTPERIMVEGPKTLEAFDEDFSSMPDMAQTAAVVALFCDGVSTLRGLHTLRVKETDRLAALNNELTKLGARVEVGHDTLTITPPRSLTPASIDTYDDHRMAMSFAVAAARVGGITINDPGCVAKTYPDFFKDFARLGVTGLG